MCAISGPRLFRSLVVMFLNRGHPKIVKDGVHVPLRPIVSCINSFTYDLSAYFITSMYIMMNKKKTFFTIGKTNILEDKIFKKCYNDKFEMH